MSSIKGNTRKTVNKAMDYNCFRTEIFMLVSIRMVNFKEKASISGVTVRSMLVILSTEKDKELENGYPILMKAISMSGVIKRIKKKEKGVIYGQMDAHLMVNLSLILNTVREKLSIKMEDKSKEHGNLVS